MEIVLADSAAQIDALDFLNVVISGTTNYFIHRNLIQYMIEVETIQEILDRKSFLDSYDIVDYMGSQWDDKILTADDFYDIITGVFKKETKPLTSKEKYNLMDNLQKNKVWVHNEGDCFLSYECKLPYGTHMRFYINSKNPDSACSILTSIVNEFREKGKFKIKTITGCSDGFSRYDNTMLYVHYNDAKQYLDFLKTIPDKLFDEEVPLTTRKFAKGRGYASSVLKRSCRRILEYPIRTENMSFNTLHSFLIERAFHVAIDQVISDMDEIKKLYETGMMQAAINPHKPYLRIDMQDILD